MNDRELEKQEEQADIVEELEEQEEEKLFGMRRLRGLGALLGLAAGFILSGLLPALGFPWKFSDIGTAILFGGIGYMIARLIDERLHPETRPSNRNKK